MSTSVRTVNLKPPLTDSDVSSLQIGDKVLIDGVIYTARDAAHKRLFELIDAKKDLPFPLRGQVIYYVGPRLRGQEDPSEQPAQPHRIEWTPTLRDSSSLALKPQ